MMRASFRTASGRGGVRVRDGSCEGKHAEVAERGGTGLRRVRELHRAVASGAQSSAGSPARVRSGTACASPAPAGSRCDAGGIAAFTAETPVGVHRYSFEGRCRSAARFHAGCLAHRCADRRGRHGPGVSRPSCGWAVRAGCRAQVHQHRDGLAAAGRGHPQRTRHPGDAGASQHRNAAGRRYRCGGLSVVRHATRAGRGDQRVLRPSLPGSAVTCRLVRQAVRRTSLCTCQGRTAFRSQAGERAGGR